MCKYLDAYILPHIGAPVLTILTIVNKWARHIWDIPVCWMTGEFMKVFTCSVTIITSARLSFHTFGIFLTFSSAFSFKQ